ncbi:hypothetical protein LXL04_037328 [Taraxacum kok-saghyz]
MTSKSKIEEYPAFTNFTIKVDAEGSWTDTVKKVLNSVEGIYVCFHHLLFSTHNVTNLSSIDPLLFLVKGVTNFRMENNGKINISGYIDPNLLLKCLRKLGKKAQIVHWQYGECSSNLFEKTKSPSVNASYPGYGGYNGYGYPSYLRNNNHPICAGNASDCSGHHIQKPYKSSSSSSRQFQKLAKGGPTSCCFL